MTESAPPQEPQEQERAETALEQLEASERRATQWGKENVRLHEQVAALQEALQEHHDAVAMASWTGGSAADTWGRPCPVCGRVLSPQSEDQLADAIGAFAALRTLGGSGQEEE